MDEKRNHSKGEVQPGNERGGGDVPIRKRFPHPTGKKENSKKQRKRAPQGRVKGERPPATRKPHLKASKKKGEKREESDPILET